MQALLQQAEPSDGIPATQPEHQAAAAGGSWHHIAQLLGRKHDRIDPVQALPLLPLPVTASGQLLGIH